MNNHISTGAFAKLCGTTKHTLIHYDQMGVLSPAVVGDNGYRYYAPAQIEVFHVIESLRELDMSLADIRTYLDRRSPAEFAALLDRQEKLLGEKIARLRQMREVVRGKAELTRRAMASSGEELTVGWEPERWLVCTPALPMTSDWNVAIPLAEHVRFCQAHGVVSPHAVGSMASQRAARLGDPAGYTHYYTQVDKKPRGVEVYVRPAGRYLTLCHTFGCDTLPGAYQRITQYADERGLKLEGPFFEDVLLDEMSVRGYENYVLKISVQVGDERKTL